MVPQNWPIRYYFHPFCVISAMVPRLSWLISWSCYDCASKRTLEVFLWSFLRYFRHVTVLYLSSVRGNFMILSKRDPFRLDTVIYLTSVHDHVTIVSQNAPLRHSYHPFFVSSDTLTSSTWAEVIAIFLCCIVTLGDTAVILPHPTPDLVLTVTSLNSNLRDTEGMKGV